MGKASQAKKSAREARESGIVPPRPRRRWGYPAIVTVAVVLGVLAVWYARRPESQPTSNLVTPAVETPDASAGATVSTVAGGTDSATPTVSVAP